MKVHVWKDQMIECSVGELWLLCPHTDGIIKKDKN